MDNMVLEMIGKDKKRDTCNIGLGRDRPLIARSQPHLEPTLTRACL